MLRLFTADYTLGTFEKVISETRTETAAKNL
jgi:hypothetical protein